MSGVGKSPRASAAITGIIEPLCAEALGTMFVKSDAVFEVSGVPLRNAIFCRTGAEKLQDTALEAWFTDGMLRNEPGRFGSILASEIFGRPAVLGDEFAEASGVLDVDGLHAGNVVATEFVGVDEFLAYAKVS